MANQLGLLVGQQTMTSLWCLYINKSKNAYKCKHCESLNQQVTQGKKYNLSF